MWLAGWPGSISDDKPIGVRGHHLGNRDLHGHRITLYLVTKPYAITTGAPS